MIIGSSYPSLGRDCKLGNSLADDVLKEWKQDGMGISRDLVDLYVDMLSTRFEDINTPFHIPNPYSSPEMIYVSWGDAVLSNHDHILATDTLCGCSGLIINDSSFQYLYHVLYNGTSVLDITKSLESASEAGLQLDSAEFRIMPGGSQNYRRSPLKSLEALKQIDPNYLDRVKLVRSTRRNTSDQEVILSNGECLQYPSSWITNFVYSKDFKGVETLDTVGLQRITYASNS